MTAPPMYIARCRQCGNSRRTYNDPRLGRSVIECKAACYESHYEWDFVEECKAEEAENTASSVPLPSEATPASKGTGASKKRRRMNSRCTVV
ncbi:hypothetical protein TcBrA4_0128510 [Trypanosoma cruzi]|nr:hypothetical protein TcBrA4_0128510 [Trypanosoma cruzi]